MLYYYDYADLPTRPEANRRDVAARLLAFFSGPRNLAKITLPEMNFTIKSELPAEVCPGLMIEYTVSPLLGIPLTWLTEIVHVEASHRFVDEQRVGP